MTMYCNKCGEEMKWHYDNHWDCYKCNNWVSILNGEEYWKDDSDDIEDYDTIYNDDFCRTCDSDSYPLCRGGCPYIDE